MRQNSVVVMPEVIVRPRENGSVSIRLEAFDRSRHRQELSRTPISN
jgi:hypothetical protein